MGKGCAWMLGLIFFPLVTLPFLVLYLAWLIVVGLVALIVLGLRLFGVAVGLGWVATVVGVDAYRRQGGVDGIRARLRGDQLPVAVPWGGRRRGP